jgi:amino acid permease-like protein
MPLFALGLTTLGGVFIWTWPVVALGQFIVALNFAEVSSHYPVAGSVFQWTKYMASRTYSWFTGWIYLFAGMLTVTAVVATLPIALIPALNGLGWHSLNVELHRRGVYRRDPVLAVLGGRDHRDRRDRHDLPELLPRQHRDHAGPGARLAQDQGAVPAGPLGPAGQHRRADLRRGHAGQLRLAAGGQQPRPPGSPACWSSGWTARSTSCSRSGMGSGRTGPGRAWSR